jgi:hypothetical protein
MVLHLYGVAGWEVALVDLSEAQTAAQQEERVCTALGIKYVSEGVRVTVRLEEWYFCL